MSEYRSVSSKSINYYTYEYPASEEYIKVNDLCKWAKETRLKLGYSLRELSRKSGISRSTITKFERGNTNVRISSLVLILYGLGYWIKLNDNFEFEVAKMTEVKVDVL